MKTIPVFPAQCRNYPLDHEFIKWPNIGFYAIGSGNTTGGKVNPKTGEVWIQKTEFGRLRYEVYQSVMEYRETVQQYRATIERDPEKTA